jgi:hypothetical protein
MVTGQRTTGLGDPGDNADLGDFGSTEFPDDHRQPNGFLEREETTRIGQRNQRRQIALHFAQSEASIRGGDGDLAVCGLAAAETESLAFDVCDETQGKGAQADPAL